MEEVKLDEKQFKELKNEIVSIKKLVILALQHSDIKGGSIAKTLDLSQGRLSQIAATKKYKKR